MRIVLNLTKYLTLFAVCLLWLVPTPSVAGHSEKVSIQLQWLDQFQFAGYYIAKEKGFYENARLDVTILPFTRGALNPIDNVLSGTAQYGVGRSSLLVDYHKGAPIVVLSAIFQDSPSILLARDDTGIQSPRDLKGRRVMVEDDVAASTSIMSLLYMNDLSLADVQHQKHSYDLADLINKKTDAMSAYISNEPFRMTEQGVGYNILHSKNYGLMFYDDILFTSQNELNNHSDRAQAFVQASLDGWAYAFDNIEETAQLIKDKYNGQNKSLESLIYEGRALKKLAYKADTPLGEINLLKLKKIEESYQLMNVELSEQSLDNFMWAQVNSGRDGIVHFTANEKKFISTTVIRTATTTKWPPFAFVDDTTDQATGIGYDYWNEIRKIAGLKTEITKFTDFTKQLQSLKDKQQDLMYSSGVTEERKEFAKFTEPYAKFPISIATSKEENFIQDGSFLSTKKIAVGKNFTAHKMMLDAYPDITYVPVKNAREGLQLVSQGEVYAYVDIMPTLAYAINEFGFTNLKISGNTGLMFELRLMIRDDYPELVSIANKIIANFDTNKKQAIEKRWINVQYQQQFDYKKYLPYVTVLFAIFSIIFFTLHRSKTNAQRISAENEASERRYRRLLEHTSDEYFIYSHDTNGVFQYLSPSIHSVLGYEQDEFSNHYASYLTDSPINQEAKRISALSIKGEKHPPYEEEILHKNGVVKTLEISKSPVFDEAGNVIAVEGIARDITKRKQAEAQLIEAKEQAEMANTAKTQFLAAASHDLRQPLQAANLFLHALKVNATPSKHDEIIERLEHSLGSFGGLLDALLDISKLEAGEIKPVIEPVRLSNVLDKLVPEFCDLAADKGMEFHYVSSSMGIATDVHLLSTILRNLLANAIRYTEHGKTLLGCRRHGDWVSIEVWDTGIGIAEDQVGKVFDEFYQVGNKARDHKLGLGLGLSIVRRLSELLGCTLSVTSELGKGTCFILKFPSLEVVPTVTEPNPNPSIDRFNGQSILIVEDNDSVRDGLKVALDGLGFNTLALSCGDCDTCLKELDAFDPDPSLIVADYRLNSRRDGLEVITEMRQRYGESLPAILLTGDMAPSLDTMSIGLPPVVLNKPVSIPDLSNLMRSILD